MNKDENKDREFNPSESEEFYNQLDKVLSMEEQDISTEYGTDNVKSSFEMKSYSDTTVDILDNEEDDPSDDLFEGVSKALERQMDQEFGQGVGVTSKEEKNKFLAFLHKMPKWTKVLSIVILAILLSVGFLVGTKPGKQLMANIVVNFIFGKINVEPNEEDITPGLTITEVPEFTMTPTSQPTLTETPEATPGAELTPEPTAEPTPEPTPEPTKIPIMQDENVVNVLLLGEENTKGAKRGRADAILIASLDKRTGKMKLVSFLRDIYVQIPGHADNRLNASYGSGGGKLIMQTIEENFRIKLDGYVVVDFSGFEDMIDKLGGLTISLTAKESEYLNKTAYISKKSERNTVAGSQKMTGSQVLGYCRVRYVPTENGLHDDFGRTYRHRVVLKALLKKYKDKSLTELLSVMNKCFKYVTASESLKEVAADCLQVVMEHKDFDMDTLRIPKNGHYSDEKIQGKAVIVADSDNINILQEFLYGTEESE